MSSYRSLQCVLAIVLGVALWNKPALTAETILVIQAETGEAIELDRTQLEIVADAIPEEEGLVIQYELNEAQAKTFAALTEKNQGRPLLIFLQGLVIGNPVADELADGQTGTITVESVYVEDVRNALSEGGG